MNPDPAAMTILVVDDNETNRYTTGRYLKNAGFQVREAASGKEALQLAQDQPTLIILDVQLPDMTGFSVCQQIKASLTTASIPVLHTSASFRTVRDKTFGLEGGADAYLTSPLEPEELIATVRSLIRMRSAEMEAQRLSSEWQATFQAINNGVCLVGKDGIIRRHNPVFASMIGEFPGGWVGKSLAEVFKYAGIGESPLPLMWQTGKREVVETRMRESFLRVTADPVIKEPDEIVGAVCILHDITQRKRDVFELQKAKEQLSRHTEELEARVKERTAELRERNESLQEFCYSIAHDLQAPLRAVNGFTTLLQEDYGDKLDEVGQHYASRVVTSVKRMQQLVKDLLAYGQITHAEIGSERVDLDLQIANVLKELEGEIETRRAEVVVESTLPEVQGNSTLIGQVLMNLLSNALKFVVPGEIPRIRIFWEASQERVRVWIEDNGIGISPAQQARIFQVFERLHNTTSPYQGTGIGLAIVRKAMERMNGRVGVESKSGAGSRFWIEFPPPTATNDTEFQN
jgi:signal transduction histidine kinase